MTAADNRYSGGAYLRGLVTESRSAIPDLVSLDILTCLRSINDEDALVAAAVRAELPNIAAAIRYIVQSFSSGGRLIYVGAGTSGRLGVLDAVECPPTFGTEPSLVTAIIAGGPSAMYAAVEGAEDDPGLGADSISAAGIRTKDTVVGISASGQAPFVIGALKKAVELGATPIALTNNRPSKLEDIAAVTIAPIVGPEVVAGSTRMKSGTSQKMVLNLLTTTAMIQCGKTYRNLMVDVKATNSKLRARALHIVIEVTGTDEAAAVAALEQCAGSAKLAILVIETGLSPTDAESLLAKNVGFLGRALLEHALHR